MTRNFVFKNIASAFHTSLLIASIGVLPACQAIPIPDFVKEAADNWLSAATMECPKVRILKAGQRYIQYQSGAGRDITDIELDVQIIEVKYTCDLRNRGDERLAPQDAPWNIVVGLDISFRVRREVLIQQEKIENIPFFIALLDRFGQVVEKQIFSTNLLFSPETSSESQVHREHIVLKIPIHDVAIAASYETVVSFQLSQEQLDLTNNPEDRTNSR